MRAMQQLEQHSFKILISIIGAICTVAFTISYNFSWKIGESIHHLDNKTDVMMEQLNHVQTHDEAYEFQRQTLELVNTVKDSLPESFPTPRTDIRIEHLEKSVEKLEAGQAQLKASQQEMYNEQRIMKQEILDEIRSGHQ